MSKTLSPSLQSKREALASIQLEIKQAQEKAKAQKAEFILQKAQRKAQRQAQLETKLTLKLEKAQARLAKLLSKQVGPVGSKAIKANKRPSKAIVTTSGV